MPPCSATGGKGGKVLSESVVPGVPTDWWNAHDRSRLTGTCAVTSSQQTKSGSE